MKKGVEIDRAHNSTCIASPEGKDGARKREMVEDRANRENLREGNKTA
jgi:hypothetical protein